MTAETQTTPETQKTAGSERGERTELIAEQERQHQAWLAKTYAPPPF